MIWRINHTPFISPPGKSSHTWSVLIDSTMQITMNKTLMKNDGGSWRFNDVQDRWHCIVRLLVFVSVFGILH